MGKFVGVTQTKTDILLYYYEVDGKNTFLKVAKSHNGLDFNQTSKYVFVMDSMLREKQSSQVNQFSISKHGHQYLMLYKKKLFIGSLSTDLVVWHEMGPLEGVKESAAVLSDYVHKDSYVMYTGDKNLHVAYSSDLKKWHVKDESLLTPRKNVFDSGPLQVGNAHLINNHILLTYYSKKDIDGKTHYSVGAAFFDRKNPEKLLYRSEEPVWEVPKELANERLTPFGSVVVKEELILYWIVNDTSIYSTVCPLPIIPEVSKQKVFNVLIKKHKDNPIISPRPNVPWESRATFNTAAIYEDGKVHFLYRALGDNDLSVLGYATSTDGTTIDERPDEPAYIPREPFETPGGHSFSTIAQHFVSGGGYGGVEDPRITRVEDKVYLTYVAFDGATPPRAAMSSIHINDFLANKWDTWDKAKLISAPGMVNKSAVVLPRKVKGKYVVMHRVYPNILVDYLDNLEFNDYLQGHYFIPPRKGFWDSKKVGAGAPPMETKDGWLLIYQSVGYQDPGRYKIGAMMLDINNPSKVLYRTPTPIIEPNEPYENDGFKAGVVYPCGAVIMKNKLHIYYGGADSVVCAASANLDEFLDTMKHHQEPRLQKVTSNILQ